MDWIHTLLSRFAGLLRRSRLDADLEDELRAHIELATAERSIPMPASSLG